ncbi:ABC-type transport auxiliary lipoprotein family protein [Sphingomonas qomolangmaensis]|uniref:ABC-type transport auxiliary lipoprotein family protein n=1 Tax=Sphingomonas qomolangmaensis TaxID=2918765 RepID=A0ABY5L7A2_9SPHN|nr:ABC-type transport auxiliary lipoprotein family protein [Sphingomonas qomolangmaensis]UUL81851.1 ABC-type transport auxiliary lipoprotein family protein [Sphingomonas qomolangmaensis]
MKTLAILLAALPLSACISFGAEPPPSLLTLTSAAAVPVGETQNSGTAPTITIGVPSTPQELGVARVPVRSTDTSIAYVKDAQWVEPPARLFARLLADTMTARTGRVVLSGRQSNVDPGALLSGELRSFGFEAATSEAVVTYDGALLRKDATAFEKRRFEARVPVTAIDAANAGVALNQAANQVAAEVADWVGR